MNLSRRQFIRNSSVAGGALSLGFTLSACSPSQLPKANVADFQPDSFLRITPDNQVIVQIHKAEMGQGVLTGIVTLIAEELEVDPALVRYEWAPVHAAFADPDNQLQITGGSASIRVYYDILREVGATARTMLLTAAVQQTGKPVTELYAEDGSVKGRDGSVSVSYGDLVATANTLTVPGDVVLKTPDQFTRIGRQHNRLDSQVKIDGRAQFGMDVLVPDALVAVVLRCPLQAGSCADWDAEKARALPGVVDIFQIDAGIAVVANNYWRARKAAEAVAVNWQPGSSPLQSSAAIDAELTAAFAADDFESVRDEGKAPDPGLGQELQAEYDLPFLAHAAMEPLNATVAINGDRAQVWVGHQSPDIARAAAARALGLAQDNVLVHNQFLGGGFGRRAVGDNVFEAAQIAGHLKQPVKLVWSREDDTRHDYYRPVMKSRMRAQLSDDGAVYSYQHRLAGPSINQKLMPEIAGMMLPNWVPHQVPALIGDVVASADSSSVEGAADIPYAFPHLEVSYKNVETPLPLGYWRSVGHSHTAFVVESFIDEMAHAAGQDPLKFRRRWLPADSRQRAVLDKVAAMSSWGRVPAGRYQGIAVHESFHTVVAEVVELSVTNGRPKLEKVYCAVDCGRAINPDIVEAQMEGGIIFGLTAALKGQITLKDGRVEQSNFHDYQVLRMNEVPEIEIAILDIDRDPSGVGEPGTPPVAPALGNALFAVSGKRQRRLPFDLA